MMLLLKMRYRESSKSAREIAVLSASGGLSALTQGALNPHRLRFPIRIYAIG